jgi:putative SOS response-associated peptidase YedK
MINARAETVATAPAFRSAFKKTCCLIPASGFYEWQKREDETKQPTNIA